MNKINLEKLIEEALEIDSGLVNENSSMNDIEEWDSLGHLSILLKLDEELGGEAGGIKELAEAKSVNEIFEILKSKGFTES